MRRESIEKTVLVLCVIAILIFSLLPGHFTPAYIVNHDKIAHMTAFFFLALMVCRTFGYRKVVRLFWLMTLFAFLIEISQLLFTYRGFSWEDLLFDALGVLIYLSLFRTVMGLNAFLRAGKKNKF